MPDLSKPVEIWFPLPPTMNEIINEARRHRFESSKLKKEWTNTCRDIAIGYPSFPDKVWMAWVWHINNLARDEDNLASARKFICDGLVQAGVLKNDSCLIIQTPVVHWHERSKNDAVMVAIADNPNFLFQWMNDTKDLILAQLKE